ncbi:MAG: 4Fe-4S dicluster domain-containing protein [Clostridiales bacterium]|nr:4Fe-4S dicluster domain-containing protein [Clostridiales bacterium]
MKKIDERDTMFARMAWESNSDAFRDYYNRNPDKLEFDEELRTLPNLSEEGTATYDSINSRIVDGLFRFIADLRPFAEGEIIREPQVIDPETATRRIKEIARHFGASIVGITKTEDYHYYSHRGRMEKNYGEEITKKHKYAIAFAVEMDKDFINRSPQIEQTIETTHGYLTAAVVGMVVSYFLREIGYDARNHMDGNYLVVAPLVAQDAGIGEIGRLGILITKEYGPRVRLGVVTTDLELIPDISESFGVKEFCEICDKCSKTCPGRAIPSGIMGEIEGVKRWKIDQEKCYRIWRSLGTDCGVCLSTCPFSQGIDLDKINSIMGNTELMKEILEEHEKKYGIRNYMKEKLNIIK